MVHNCKRRRAGLPETFAYSCEAFGWIVEHARNRQERLALGQEFEGEAHRFGNDDVDADELASIVREACEARNGWEVILQRCAPAKPMRRTPTAPLPESIRST
ncbi:MAG: hypothetical protein ABSC94_28370 [Polyangiaceae bacterium]